MAMKYRRDIDGLRCLAIVPVVLFHVGADYFPAGFVGVDIFFVISGFLITSVIRQEIRQNSFTIAGFYERRCRRILPALIAMISACFFVGYFTMLPGQYADFGSSAMAALLFVSNGFFWRQTGYFSPAAGWMPLLNTWSLAVEEQYYIIFPIFMWMVRRWRVSGQLLVVGIVFAVSFLMSAYGAYRHPSAAFYLTPFRAWELLLGVLIAYSPSPTLAVRWLRELASFAGLLMLLVPIVVYDARTPFPGFAAVVPCLGTAILLVAGGAGSSIVKSVLSHRVLVFVGLISYSLYLWHWPVFVFMRLRLAQTELPTDLALLGTLLSFCIAVLSWHFVEKPFRRREAFDRSRIFIYSATSALLTLAIAGGVRLSDGIPGRVVPQALAFEEASKDVDPFQDRCRGRVRDPLCDFGGQESTAVSFALWGDSHASAFRPALEEAMKGSGRRGTLIWLDECPPLIGAENMDGTGFVECRALRERALDFLTEPDNSIETVFLSARWLTYATGSLSGARGSRTWLIKDEQSVELSLEENGRVFIRSMNKTIEELRSADKNVVLLGGVPEVGWNLPPILALSLQHRLNLPQPPSHTETEKKHAAVDRVFTEMARGDGVTFIPVWSLLCPEQCLIIHDNRPIYSDGHHLSLFGAKSFLGAALKERFETSGISEKDN